MVAGRGDAAVGGGAWWDVREDVLRRGHGEDRWGEMELRNGEGGLLLSLWRWAGCGSCGLVLPR